MRVIVRIILLVWFCVASLFIFIPSYQILSTVMKKVPQPIPNPVSPPGPPILPTIDSKLDIKVQEQQVEAYKQQVSAYSQQVTAYTQQVVAYKAGLDSEARDARISAYDTVVKSTMATLLTSFFAALIGLAFANVGMGLLNNYIRAKNNQLLQSIELW